MRNRLRQRNWILRIRSARVGAMLAFMLTLVSTVIATQSAQAQTFTTLLSFDGTNGSSPFGALVQGFNGNMYGTTSSGGPSNLGTIFKLTPGGTLTTLVTFNGTNGSAPLAGLVQATNGTFYGTTFFGGVNDRGIVFKITTSGKLSTLYTFCSQAGCTDGSFPVAGLIQAANGDLYGTTFYGGATNNGTIFRITLAGTLTTLYTFCLENGCGDGANPYGLIQASNGSIYGTTNGGGVNGVGTIFKITPSGTLATLHSFDSTNGSYPTAALVQANDGDFYGTTQYGGTYGACYLNCGTVFRVTLSGTLTTLHSFDGTDGSYPLGGLIQATDGNFYGTTGFGGLTASCPANCGTVFTITPGGTLTTLHNFDGTDGYSPHGGLLQATNGILYGSTAYRGADTVGTVFGLSMGLGPFVETQPVFGNVGAAVRILGTNLEDATSVTFNGTAATFTVVSRSEITATVPVGATSGIVEVTIPSGTLNSNTKFHVVP